jgi:hypothetical protein
MPRGSSPKRERQYEHIVDSERSRGETGGGEGNRRRTAKKERARAGESRTASKTSARDISAGRRGGLRSRAGPAGRTKAQLYADAKRRNIKGRSTMTRAQLERALAG